MAVVPELTASTSNIANVTPLTTGVAALLAPAGDLQALATAVTLASSATQGKVNDATALLVNALRADPQTDSLLGAAFSPLSTPFVANGGGIDAVLERVEVAVSATGVTLTNQASPVGASGAPASVTLTAAMTAAPATAPKLPVSVCGQPA